MQSGSAGSHYYPIELVLFDVSFYLLLARFRTRVKRVLGYDYIRKVPGEFGHFITSNNSAYILAAMADINTDSQIAIPENIPCRF